MENPSKWLMAALALLGMAAQAYDTVGLSGGPCGVDKFMMVAHPSEKKRDWLWLNGPRLDSQWRDVSFSFTPEGSGQMVFSLGASAPWREGDIPFYFDDIRLNGVPLGAKVGWKFNPPPPNSGSSKTGGPFAAPGLDKPCLRLYYGSGASHEFAVKKGEKVEITMRAKAGSVLDFYAGRLEALANSLDECAKLPPQNDVGAPPSAQALAAGINAFAALSAKELAVAVPALPDKVAIPAALQAKLRELRQAYLTELNAVASAPSPVLYDKLEARKKFLAQLNQLAKLTADLKTDLLLRFMFGG